MSLLIFVGEKERSLSKILYDQNNMKQKIIYIVVSSLLAHLAWADMFALPKNLEPGFNFWKDVYSKYDSNQVVFYIMDRPEIRLDVLDLPKVPNEISAPKYRADVQKRMVEITDALNKLTSKEKPKDLSPLEQKIAEILKKNSLDNESDLVKRLRSQSGLKSQFGLGLKLSGRYIDEVKAVLVSQGLPAELVALVFVESLWNLNAVSHAGASGPWGFVRDTALRSGIFVNRFTDERLDPVVAAYGAAQFLKKAKEGLGEWPLAITAYNYGYAGMLRAVSALETKDIAKVIAEHESPIFGYASKNYYLEFLAALHVYTNREKYFPGLSADQPWNYELVQILRPIEVRDLVQSKAISKEHLAAYNPGLTRYTVDGHEVIPAQYTLRVPKGSSKIFYDRVKKIPESKREQAKWKISTKYHAKGNETLELIARKNGIFSNLLAGKLGQPVDYKPKKGAINIRSYFNGFTQLAKIAENIVATLSPAKIAANPKR